ncbi:MAG: DMT family transporter [Chloroflexota bacterium]|nr:DMT family transporter [Chloroflexota bacterium]
MPLSAIALVLTAAVLHAIWHLLAKHANDTSAFMWWGIAVGAAWFGAILSTQKSLELPPSVWPIYAGSMLAEFGYLSLITRGYTLGDLSQVYPISRGAPPFFVAIWSALLLGERLPVAGYLGVALLIVGVYVASLPSFRDIWRPLQAVRNRPAQLALLAAICVAIYTTLDKRIVASVDPVVYNFWVYAGIAVVYAPMVWLRGDRRSATLEVRGNWRRILVDSVSTVGSYMLALVALSQTAASYVGAVRASSVVIGALFGWLLLGERLGVIRVVAAAIMLAGLAMIALAN